MRLSDQQQTRFEQFQLLIKHELGNQVFMAIDGDIIVSPNEFSPQLHFWTLQAAIDHYAYLLPASFVNP